MAEGAKVSGLIETSTVLFPAFTLPKTRPIAQVIRNSLTNVMSICQ